LNIEKDLEKIETYVCIFISNWLLIYYVSYLESFIIFYALTSCGLFSLFFYFVLAFFFITFFYYVLLSSGPYIAFVIVFKNTYFYLIYFWLFLFVSRKVFKAILNYSWWNLHKHSLFRSTSKFKLFVMTMLLNSLIKLKINYSETKLSVIYRIIFFKSSY